MELSKSVKVPKFIRYLLIGIIVLFFAAVIGVIILTGVPVIGENVFLGILVFALAIFMLIMGIVKFRKTYLKRK